MSCRQPRKCQRNQTDSSSANRGHIICLVLTFFIRGTVNLPPPVLVSSLRLKCFRTFLSLCSVFNRSLWAISMMMNCPVMFRELLMSCDSESTSVWVKIKKEKRKIFPPVKSARMYAHVCFGNYLFKLFKRRMSKHPYQYFFVWNVRFKPQLQANSPKLPSPPHKVPIRTGEETRW